MSTRSYVPDRGDIVWLQFNPQAGHEQAGHRPALVLSPASYNRRSGLMLCCPMTSQRKGYPFEVVVEVDTDHERGACGPSQEFGLESPEGGEERDRVDRRDRGNTEQASSASVTTSGL